MAAPMPTSSIFMSISRPELSSQSSLSLSSSSSIFLSSSPSVSLSFQCCGNRQRSSVLQNERRGGRRSVQFYVSASGDYYSTLGISKSANSKQIKAAYRSLARQYHPDVNKQPGATDKFKEISTAYEVLSDDKKRALYDRYGEAGLQSSVGGAAGTYTTNPFDLFETFFGGSMGNFSSMDEGAFRGRKRTTSVRGDDIRYDMLLEFSEAIFGAEKDIILSHLEKCEACTGTGSKSGSRMKICSTCGGRGQVMRTEQTPFGLFSQVSVCSNCGGDGEMISEFCRKCSGEGRIRVRKNIKVNVPPGVSKGSTLRVRGEGDAGLKGGAPGDLYVCLEIIEIPEIQRDGINLYSSVAINYIDAILGSAVQVKAIDGITEVQIPSGTQPGDVVVLAKRGVPRLNKPSIRGDHLFTVKVTIPNRLSARERELLEELASLSNGNVHHLREQAKPQSKRVETQKNIDVNMPKQTNEEESNVWQTLKDFTGSITNGFLNWLNGNI
ncbi:Chaperone protein dnaJ [Zostera marina]|uniref:Chaperone protein dnaJ n=1 Tax=Zostera marina TaxID=29655 RepID=A0A0K9PFL9_ZOSMR|nr:Chaperone protein dnaJ [Zostera marina]